MPACCMPQDVPGQRDRPCLLGAADRLLMTLMYWREYRTQAHIAVTYGVSEPTVCRTIRRVEARLTASGKFALPGKKVLQEPRLAFDVVIAKAPRQRQEKAAHAQSASRDYQGAKRIVATAFCAGKRHDFTLFKASALPLQQGTCCLGDSGYQGLQNQHENSPTPYKKSKYPPLTPEQKQANKSLSQERLLVEHVIGWLKRFRLLCGPYRNRRKRLEVVVSGELLEVV
jgi:hypothetical protein